MQPRVRERIAVDYPVTFTGDQLSGTGILTNLTIAGGAVEGQSPSPIGAHLALHVQSPGARKPIVIALAVVRWQQDNRFGLEFVRFEGNAKQQLQEMLNQSESSSSL
jgi:hypothetical protein